MRRPSRKRMCECPHPILPCCGRAGPALYYGHIRAVFSLGIAVQESVRDEARSLRFSPRQGGVAFGCSVANTIQSLCAILQVKDIPDAPPKESKKSKKDPKDPKETPEKKPRAPRSARNRMCPFLSV